MVSQQLTFVRDSERHGYGALKARCIQPAVYLSCSSCFVSIRLNRRAFVQEFYRLEPAIDLVCQFGARADPNEAKKPNEYYASFAQVSCYDQVFKCIINLALRPKHRACCPAEPRSPAT